jgi:hypothetical protein
MIQRLLVVTSYVLLLMPACGNRATLPVDARFPDAAPDAASPPEDTGHDPDIAVVAPEDLVVVDLLDPQDVAVPADLTFDGGDAPEVVSPPADLIVPDLPPEEKPLLRINEVVANAPGGGPDWFELLATGDEAVFLGDYTVVDGDVTHTPVPLPKVTLQPGDFIVVEAIAAGDWSANPSVPFKFGSNDALILALDTETVDQVSWWGQAPPEGTGYGRLPDGTGDWQLTQPTSSAPNADVKLKLSTCYDPFLWDRATPVSLTLEDAAWQAMLATPEAEEWQAANFQFGPMKLSNIAVRVKGGKSITKIAAMGSHRFSFKVDFNRYVDIMQFCGLKKVVFHNGYGDPTLLREHLAYRLARHLGVPAPRTAFVDLTIGSEHLGIYLMVESVDDDFFLDEHFKNDKGDLYEAGAPAGALLQLGDTFADYPGFQIEKNAGTTAHQALLYLLSVLNNGAPGDYATALDLNDTLQYLAWNTALVNLDSYNGEGRNYYLYEQEGIFTPIPWDANEAFGSHGCGCTQDQLLELAVDEPTCGPMAERPLLARLLAVPQFKEKYRGYLQELLDGGFNPTTFGQWLEEPANIIRSLQAESNTFYTAEQFEAALVDGLPGGGPDGDDIFGLTSFVTTRSKHLKEQLNGTQPAGTNGLGNCIAE